MNYDDNEGLENVKKAAMRAWEMEPGKTIIVDIGGVGIRADYRCMDKDTDVCDDCKLKFSCYVSQYLVIDGKRELNLTDIGQTINEKVEAYVEARKPKPKEKVDKE